LTPFAWGCPVCIGRDDLADTGGITLRWIDAGTLRSELVQIALEPLELANTRLDLGAMLLNELQHVNTWGCSGIANSDYFADLGET
jgi:hypothetical protein